MQTEYAKPGVFFGMEFGKPVRLPQIKKSPQMTNRQNSQSHQQTEISLEKCKENLKNRTNAFNTSQINKRQGKCGLPKISNNTIDEEVVNKLERVRSERHFGTQVHSDLVGTYRLGAIIGRGSSSTVKVVRNWKGGIYAMKTYERVNQYDSFKRKNIKNQIQIMEQLNHPLIIKYIETVYGVNTINIVTELIQNISLKQFMKKKKEKRIEDVDELKCIMKDVLEALQYLHGNGIAHRDIKLQNILIGKNLKIKLIDFGFSVRCGQWHYDFCGTPNYISPEIISKGGYAADKADIWAAGVMFYKLHTGLFPFKGMNDKILYRKICRGEYKLDECTNYEIQNVIDKMLQMDYNLRPSAKELLEESLFSL